jgi:signal transduction histidine kinase
MAGAIESEEFALMAITMSEMPQPLGGKFAFAISLRGQMWLLWVFIVLLSMFIAAILVGLYRSGSAVQIEAGRRSALSACEQIKSLYAVNVTQRTPVPQLDPDVLRLLVSEVLTDAAGVEGGIWERERGFFVYAFPTHEGAAPKLDPPAAELPWIAEQIEQAFSQGAVTEEIRRGTREAVVVAVCPLSDQRAVWAMTRVRTASSEAFDRLAWGLALLLGFALVSGGWLAMTLSRWSRGMALLETTLRDHSVDRLPRLDRTGHGDIDRIVEALNGFTLRLAVAREEAATLNAKLVHSERLAALGRVAAGIAHEIRNPIAAMRLKAENALAHSPDRQREALGVMLGQIDRLNDLCESLLSLARPLRVERQEVAVAAWLAERLASFKDRAQAEGIELQGSSEVGSAWFDPAQIGRALDNLITNALQHTPEGGRIDIAIHKSDDAVSLTVSDTGTGIAESLRGSLFEPFASDRTGGTGLGLAIAREIVEAHGGSIRAVPVGSGATFEIEIPWHAS